MEEACRLLAELLTRGPNALDIDRNDHWLHGARLDCLATYALNWASEEEHRRALATNTRWDVFCFPDHQTHISISASTLEAALRAVLAALDAEGSGSMFPPRRTLSLPQVPGWVWRLRGDAETVAEGDHFGIAGHNWLNLWLPDSHRIGHRKDIDPRVTEVWTRAAEPSGTRCYFLDFEASSLNSGSRPIEVAWVDADGRGESHLIRPAPGWEDWSPASERLHGISREMLEREGKPHSWVAKRALAALAGAEVFADQPAFDGHWLGMLLEAAGIPERIPVLDVALAYGRACRPLLEAGDRHRAEADARRIVAEAEEAGMVHGRARHRALPDAEALWRRWREIGRRAAEAAGRKG